MTQKRKRILVLGLGRSGNAAARLLVRHGFEVTGYDRDPARGAHIEGLAGFLSGPTLPDFEDFDRVVQSPGIRVGRDPRLVPEVEIGAEHLQAPIIGVTGTNGKSTTTVLIADMLRASGLDVATGGNLGTALCELVDMPADRVVAELSSFQLEHAQRFPTSVAVLLNLAPDHLDRHGSMKAYGAAKARLATLQGPEGVLVYNADDPWAQSVSSRGEGRRVTFSAQRELDTGASVRQGHLVVAEQGREPLSIALGELAPAARSPIDNALAASAAAIAAGGSPEGIAKALGRFEGLPHRAALVGLYAGVRYVNDSKATNPTATVRSLESCNGPIAWLAGGRNKGLDLAPLAGAVRHVRVAIVYGEAATELEKALGPACPVIRTRTLDEAFAEVTREANPGETVLLSPGCASQDAFASFEERGERFEALVRALEDRPEPPC
jgi:UDP-N-acetylmuramoylalanine--D-glutamate ligase